MFKGHVLQIEKNILPKCYLDCLRTTGLSMFIFVDRMYPERDNIFISVLMMIFLDAALWKYACDLACSATHTVLLQLFFLQLAIAYHDCVNCADCGCSVSNRPDLSYLG